MIDDQQQTDHINERSSIPPAVHGAIDYEEVERLGLPADSIIDFSVNSNPFGPPAGVREAIAKVALDRYPDRQVLAFRRALAAHLDESIDRLVVGNGTAELLMAVALAFIRPGDRVLIIGPTFGEYERVSRLMGAKTIEWRAEARTDFSILPQAVAEMMAGVKPRLVFLCNPNNPTGSTLSLDILAEWAKSCPQSLFVVDEAYLSFAPGLRSALTLDLQNMVVLRSMTKDYALAGLRLGYAAAPQPLAAELASVLPPWNVNALAQVAGVAALAEKDYLAKLKRLGKIKEELTRGLAEIGYRALPSAVHYFLLDVDSGAAFRQDLLKEGILVRDCASFGLPNFIRIATKLPQDNNILLKTIPKREKKHAR